MMNLELLMFASKAFDNDTLEYVARTHANTTLKIISVKIILLIIQQIMTLKMDMCVAGKQYRVIPMNHHGGEGKPGRFMAIQ